MIFYIGDYEIRASSHELLHKSVPKKIEPQVFKLLLFMLENTDRVLSRDELMSKVWENRVISDSALSASICAARHAIGDSANRQNCIKTVSGSGYRFIAKFTYKKTDHVHHNQSLQTLTHQAGVDHSFSEKSQIINDIYSNPRMTPDKPSIAVTDFIDTSFTKKGALLAYGLTAEINSALARLPHFFVIARASTCTLSKQKLLPNEIGQRLGVRYLVYGNTKYSNQQIQITVSVIDAAINREIWSEHFNQPIDNLFQVQEEIIQSTVATIDSTIELAEIDRAFLIPSEDLRAWETYHQGIWHCNRTTLYDTEKAQQLFKKAISHDPRFSRAYAGLSFIHTSKVLLNTTPSEDADNIAQAFEHAEQSIDYGKRDTMGYFSLARALWLSKEYKRAIAATESGLQVNPHDFRCTCFKGFVSAFSGFDAQAQCLLDKSQRLSPYDPIQFSMKTARAISFVHQRKFNQATDWVISAADDPNAYFSIYATASACLKLAGHSTMAKQYAQRVLELKPDYSIKTYQHLTPHGDKTTRTLIANAMHSSGIPK